MHTHTVLLHTFAVLLLCDYGMFSTPSPFTSKNPMNISNVSYPNITTAESTTAINEQTTQFGDFSDDTVDYNETTVSFLERSTNATGWVSSTARPRSTTPLVIAAPKTESGGQYAGGIILLIFILILIALLLGVLYFLRKKGRSYSFDLNRVDGPANDYDTPLRSDQQGISYEQTNKDLSVCLDYIQEEKSEEKMVNGCPAEKTTATENDERNVPEENSFSSTSTLTPPLKKVEFNLDLDLIGESDFNNPAPSGADDTDQNENNNAGRGTAEEIFTEVSLDEPKEV